MFLVLTSDTRRSNQLILKEINLEYSLERLMLKLNLQYFGHLMQRADSLEKTLMLGKIEGNRRRGRQRMRGLNSITKSMDVNLSQLREIMKDRGACCAIVHGVPKSRTQLIDRTTTSWNLWPALCLQSTFPKERNKPSTQTNKKPYSHKCL